MVNTNRYTSAEYVTKKLRHRINYINYIIKGIKLFGVKKYNDSLYELGIFKRVEKESVLDKDKFCFFNEDDEKAVEFILDIIIKEWSRFNIKREMLFNTTKRLEHIRARDMAVILIHIHTNISNTKIAEYFNRSRQIVFNLIKEHKKKLGEIKKHKIYFIRYNKLNRKISNRLCNKNIKRSIYNRKKADIKCLREVYQFDKKGNFIKRWKNCKVVEEKLKLYSNNILLCCERRLKTSGGFIWKFKKK